ncbi:uncharacterized protein LOC132198117 isoform X1 [Neocloeon triangulifer]|uniref:uncharacterized protein LOC132198117 isoform X1 n=1 Tax=Neocloeon triangulifer TaxID=2078957 RepID=UPI00286F4E2D|nr:uncharacterized protein LOC132198117 isoform X1 [Neocloeon triangulifer]
MAEHAFDAAASASASSNLPPGWDCKFDARTGRFYYLNYFTKTTTWEDPRLRYRPAAPTHQHVFSPSSVHSSVAGEAIPLQDLTNVRPSPIPSRAYSSSGPSSVICNQGFLHGGGSPSRMPTGPGSDCSSSQETSMSIETEQAVTKIGAMFPTVGETHIRTLLKKYHNREAVVISALQVEKHPLTTPGPFSTSSLACHNTIATNQFGIYNAYQQMLSMSPTLRRFSPPRSPNVRAGSGASSACSFSPPRTEELIRGSPRPHSSPKMKLRYMKGLFPNAEETLLLDVLSNADNNVQKASEKLASMGFEKRDSPPPRVVQKHREEEQKAQLEKQSASATPTPPPRLKSSEEKQKMKKRLQELYPNIPERVVTIALDSSDFDEERAGHILQVMVEDETSSKNSSAKLSSQKDGELHHKINITTEKDETPVLVESSPARSRKNSPAIKTEKEKASIHKRAKGKKEVTKVSRGTSTAEDKEYRSCYLQKANGPNINLLNGPNNNILLVDYVTWQGPNSESRAGPRKALANGPNVNLREGKTYTARGPNKSLCSGPKKGLAMGSIYSGLKCSVDTRGK